VRPIDTLSIVGILIGAVAILGGNALEGGHVSALVNGPAALIVVGGTVGAAALQTPLPQMKLALQRLGWIFMPPPLDFKGGIAKIVRWSNAARKEGLLGLEAIADAEPDPFTRKALQLLVDGNEPEAIRTVMEMESDLREQRELEAARFYESMGGYSPTIGIIGAVMGLIHVMGNLADPSRLGPGIAVAFVATIYGVALANLFLLPVASKLKSRARAEARLRDMMTEGIVSIADGENPRAIELKLTGFADQP
jgi:chemotaxis protein MotA